MSFQLNVPPSMVRQMAKDEAGAPDEESASKKREDWKKLKELEEARKAGTAPAMQDEEGKDINPHIPQYIMQAPWYFGSTAPTLRHQRPQDEKHKPVAGMDTWYKRGSVKAGIATKYRKGACENCGAMTHKKKDCMERPRKLGAKYTGTEIAPDEFIQPKLDFDYAGKRDRWNGYDPEMHKKIVDEYAEIEEAKRQLKADKMDQDLMGDAAEEVEKDGESEEEGDEDKYADFVDMPGQKFETKQRITVRNLRIREDTAKYLYNLDVNSAYYDPKTRSMRENPFKGTPKEEAMYGGDNFVRWSGDAQKMAERQMFAWQAYEKGTEAHLQADPTKLEILSKEFTRKKEDYKTTQKDSILAKYGGEEHLEAPPKELLLAQTEDYVEYSRHGTVIKGQEKARVKSRYEEDVYINNHTSVWGSFWHEGQWGYHCCHSLIKMSYCTGAAGKQAKEESNVLAVKEVEEKDQPMLKLYYEQQAREREEAAAREAAEKHAMEKEKKKKARNKKKKDKKKKNRRKKKTKKGKKGRKRKHKKRSSSSSDDTSSSSSDSSSSSSSSDSDSSNSESEDENAAREKRILEAMKREEARVKEIDKIMKMDERKRPYNSMYDVKEPTEEEMEAFRRKRVRADDPMAQFL